MPLEHRMLLTATLCLLGFGSVMVYSSSAASSLLAGEGDGSGVLVRFLIYGAVGLVLMHWLARGGLARAERLTGPLLAVSFVLVLAIHLPHLGVTVNGAGRWLGYGPLQFQPSELLKLALVLYTAALVARRPEHVRSLRRLTRPLLLVIACASLLVVIQPDIGTAMVIAFTTAAMLLAAGMPLTKLALLAFVVVAVVAIYALARPYARARLTSFIDPWAHASASGFQAVQGQIAIGSGGMFGVGPGESVQKIFYLPAAQTDFILAVIAEELGVVGVFGLLCLYGLIAYAGLRTAKAARSLYAAMIAVGVTALIVSQALLNAFAVLGLAPLTGVPLPLVSYGSSSMIVTLAAMGLLLDVAAGAGAHLSALPGAGARPRRAGAARGLAGDAPRREAAGWSREPGQQQNRDRRRGDGWARGTGDRRGRRATG
jgi:cell division protein FtsW